MQTKKKILVLGLVLMLALVSGLGSVWLHEQYAPTTIISQGERFIPVIMQIHVDTLITTKNPERFVQGFWSSYPQFVLYWWTLSGRMTQVEDEYTIQWSHHAGTLTSIGKDFIEGKLSNSAFANATKYLNYISLSTSASAPSSAWTELPTEITTNGFERALGTYASTGVGTWTVTKQFTASETHTSVQLTGLEWDSTFNGHCLGCADTFTPTTFTTGEKLTIIWTGTAS